MNGWILSVDPEVLYTGLIRGFYFNNYLSDPQSRPAIKIPGIPG